jgi:hypothetical protein
MESSGQLHALAALHPKKGSPVPSEQESGWAAEHVWTIWEVEKFVSTDYRPRLLGNPARNLSKIPLRCRHEVVQLVEALCYKPEGHGIGFRLCH